MEIYKDKISEKTTKARNRKNRSVNATSSIKKNDIEIFTESDGTRYRVYKDKNKKTLCKGNENTCTTVVDNKIFCAICVKKQEKINKIEKSSVILIENGRRIKKYIDGSRKSLCMGDNNTCMYVVKKIIQYAGCVN